MGLNTNLDERSRNANVDSTTLNGNASPPPAEPPVTQVAKAKAAPKKPSKKD